MGYRVALLSAEAAESDRIKGLLAGGGTIEILIDVKDIRKPCPYRIRRSSKATFRSAGRRCPARLPGMYVDIFMFVGIGEGDWNAITHTRDPVDIGIGIYEELKAEGRKSVIIRSHDGAYTLLTDLDDVSDTITTDLFSAYTIAYVETDRVVEDGRCGLCHICPISLGICYLSDWR